MRLSFRIIIIRFLLFKQGFSIDFLIFFNYLKLYNIKKLQKVKLFTLFLNLKNN